MPAPAATKEAIVRALKAASDCGLQVTGFVVGKDGSIQVTTAPPPKKALAESSETAEVLAPRRWQKR